MNTRKDCILALDIGTSSTKALCIDHEGKTVLTKISLAKGTAVTAASVGQMAVRAARESVDKSGWSPCAISLTSQVGSYFPYRHDIPPEEIVLHSWQSVSDSDYANDIISSFDERFWMEQINMLHPKLGSYPGPFLCKLRAEDPDVFERFELLLSIKDYIYYLFTGIFATDPYTWRGLANIKTCSYPQKYLDFLEVESSRFPPLYPIGASPGTLLQSLSEQLGIRANIPVFVGCNDFYAGLKGSGCMEPMAAFDVTGTSEHIGIIAPAMLSGAPLISSLYFEGFVTYGVTASSGNTLDWAQTKLSDGFPQLPSKRDLPVFLPYLSGERTPYYSNKASGAVFGLRTYHTTEDIMLAAAEGVAFSLYHIWSFLPKESRDQISCLSAMGGGTRIPLLNRIKAELFGIPVHVSGQTESSAVGAAMIAAVACGWFSNDRQAVKRWCPACTVIEPDMKMQGYYLERYQRYKAISECVSKLF